MSSSAQSLTSMAISNRSLVSLPINLVTKTSIYPYILKPTKLHLSHYFSSLSLNNQPFSSNIVPFVAQTSLWGSQEEEEEEPPEGAKVFIGNLPYDVNSERLAHVFEKSGIVEIAEVIYNRETDQSRGFGFVTMSTVEEADKAVDMFHRYELNGRILTVNKASERGSERERAPRVYEHAYRMYVGNLPWSVDNARLEQMFREYGRVVDARVMYERETGRSRGFGFVTMSTEAELNDAIASVNGLNLDGRAIKVNVAEERPRRTF